MQHRVWMPQNPTFQEWISSPSDPVSVANYSKHLTSKTKSLIQKLVFKGLKHMFFPQKKHIETIQDISSEKEQPREMHQSPNRFCTKKTSEPTRKHLEKRECQSLLIFLRTLAWLIPLEPNREQQMPKPNEPSPVWISRGNSSWSD